MRTARGSAVLQHVGDAVGGVRRVQRHVGAAGLEHRQQADDHLRRALHADRHARVRSYAALAQMVRETVGACVQLRVRQRAGRVHHGRGVGGALHLRLEQLVHARIGGVLQRRGVERLQHLRALRRGEQREAIHRLLLVGDHRLQHHAEVAEVALDGGLLKERGRVRHATDDAPARLLHLQRQVELRGDVRRAAHAAEAQARELQAALGVVLPGEHHLEERAVRHAAGRLHQVHHLLERDVLVVLRTQRTLLHPPEQLGNRRRAAQVHADRERVDEEADQPLDLAAPAVGRRRADDDILLAREAAEAPWPRRPSASCKASCRDAARAP